MNQKNLANPLAEVFGFPTENRSNDAKRYRQKKLCPFNNRVPNCTKDKANNPLGVCSVITDQKVVITCPIRFRQGWVIIEKAAQFLFPKNTKWTSLTEIRLPDAEGQSAGSIDFALISYDGKGKLLDFGSLEVQAVYISGNLINPFEAYIKAPTENFKWPTGFNYPKPDYLSSSRKRLVPQMLYKGGIFKTWGKKQAVALQKSFFDTLPNLPKTNKNKADIAWFLYDLKLQDETNSFHLNMVDVIYTEFEPALLKITTPRPGDPKEFTNFLQEKLDERLEGFPPDAPTLKDIIIE